MRASDFCFSAYANIRKTNEAFVAFWSTLILICRTSRITLCGKSCDLERKYVVFAIPVSQKRRRQPIFFILDSLSAQMNVPDTKFSRKTMKHLNHNASTLRTRTAPIREPRRPSLGDSSPICHICFVVGNKLGSTGMNNLVERGLLFLSGVRSWRYDMFCGWKQAWRSWGE